MPTLDTVAAFSLAALILAAVPGPDMVFVASRALTQGTAAGMTCIAGFVLGTYVHATIAATGLAALAAASPAALSVTTWLGALYLLYLAITTISSQQPDQLGLHSAATTSHSSLIWQGFCVNVLNPKMFIFYASFLPQFVDPTKSIFLQILFLTTVMNLIGGAVNASVAATASRTGSLVLGSAKIRRALDFGVAAVFVVLALRLILENVDMQ